MDPIIINVEGECEIEVDESTIPPGIVIEIRSYDVPVDPSRPECYSVGDNGRVYSSDFYKNRG